MPKQVSLVLAPKTQNGLLGSDIKWVPVPFHWWGCVAKRRLPKAFLEWKTDNLFL